MAEPQAGLEALRPLHGSGPGLIADPLLWLALGAGLALAAAAALAAPRALLRQRALRREALAELRLTSELAPAEALRAQALLLRRIARTVSGEATMQLAGEAWLSELDRIFATAFFTKGAGRCFGAALYAPQQPDAGAVQDELARLLSRLRRRA